VEEWKKKLQTNEGTCFWLFGDEEPPKMAKQKGGLWGGKKKPSRTKGQSRKGEEGKKKDREQLQSPRSRASKLRRRCLVKNGHNGNRRGGFVSSNHPKV